MDRKGLCVLAAMTAIAAMSAGASTPGVSAGVAAESVHVHVDATTQYPCPSIDVWHLVAEARRVTWFPQRDAETWEFTGRIVVDMYGMMLSVLDEAEDSDFVRRDFVSVESMFSLAAMRTFEGDISVSVSGIGIWSVAVVAPDTGKAAWRFEEIAEIDPVGSVAQSCSVECPNGSSCGIECGPGYVGVCTCDGAGNASCGCTDRMMVVRPA